MLTDKIADIDWKVAAEDVQGFVRPLEQDGLRRVWGERFFTAKVDKLVCL